MAEGRSLREGKKEEGVGEACPELDRTLLGRATSVEEGAGSQVKGRASFRSSDAAWVEEVVVESGWMLTVEGKVQARTVGRGRTRLLVETPSLRARPSNKPVGKGKQTRASQRHIRSKVSHTSSPSCPVC